MYSTYIRQFDNNVALLDEQCRKNTAFAAVVKEFEVELEIEKKDVFSMFSSYFWITVVLQLTIMFTGLSFIKVTNWQKNLHL